MNTLPKKAAIQEGIDDFHNDNLIDARPQVYNGATDDDVKRMGALLANSIPLEERDNPRLVWMSGHSFGVRDAKGVVTERITDEKGMTQFDYDGYDPRLSIMFYWESATSGASLEATRRGDDSWDVEFTDPENESRVYGSIFRKLGTEALHSLSKSEIFHP